MASGFSGLMAGMEVRSSDGHRLGQIKDVYESEILVSRRLQPTVHVPNTAVRAVTGRGVVLALTAAEVDDLYWVHAGEDLNIDLRGIYKYDYVTP
jgi:Uncharacterized protein conserved in bacteria (DUF2171)